MRTSWIPLSLLATALLVPGASAHAADGADPFDGIATVAGFLPPVVVVPSGTSVSWTAADLPHTFTEGALTSGGQRCFNVFFSFSSGSASFRLEDVDGTLQLQALQSVIDGWKECTLATTTSGLGLVNFYCSIHPWMNGLLAVYDEAVHTSSSVWHDPIFLMRVERALGPSGPITI